MALVKKLSPFMVMIYQCFSPRTHLQVDGRTKFDVQEASLSPLLEIESLFNHVDHDHVMFSVRGLIPILYTFIE